MARHLRFTRHEYDGLVRACSSGFLKGPYLELQRLLSEALRPDHAALADRIARLGTQQVRILHEHLRRQQRPAPSEEQQARCDLSVHEWRFVSQACAVIWLRDDSLDSFKGHLVQEVAEEEPRLAAKLARLDQGDIATLYRRVKAGRRWGG